MTDGNPQHKQKKTLFKIIMIYKHKRSLTKVRSVFFSNSKEYEYTGVGNLHLPRWIVENSKDWEILDDEKKYSIEDIRKAYKLSDEDINVIGITPDIDQIIQKLINLNLK